MNTRSPLEGGYFRRAATIYYYSLPFISLRASAIQLTPRARTHPAWCRGFWYSTRWSGGLAVNAIIRINSDTSDDGMRNHLTLILLTRTLMQIQMNVLVIDGAWLLRLTDGTFYLLDASGITSGVLRLQDTSSIGFLSSCVCMGTQNIPPNRHTNGQNHWQWRTRHTNAAMRNSNNTQSDTFNLGLR